MAGKTLGARLEALRKRPRSKADPTVRKQGIKLKLSERYALLEAHKAHPDWSYNELARQCGVSHETARLTCIAAGKSATDLMSAYAEPMLRQWITASTVAALRGDHRPARDWLLHAGVVEPLPDGRQYSGPAVVIVNSPLPGMPGADLTRVIEAQPVHPREGPRDPSGQPSAAERE